MNNYQRILLIIAPGIIGLLILLCISPVPLDPAYHNFADQRILLGIPRFVDVITNLAFIAAGLYGLGIISSRSRRLKIFRDKREYPAYRILFLGLILTGIGSAWYHLDPSDRSLFWDRLPMILVFMPVFSIVISERIGIRLGSRLLLPLIIAGLASVFYWRFGAGDQRFYGWIQFYPFLAICLIMILYPPRYTRAGYFWGVIAWYAAAKICELGDLFIYRQTGIISGHSLKHLFAALAAVWIILMLRSRRPYPSPPEI